MTVTTVPRMEFDWAAWVHRDKRFVELTDRNDFVGMYSKSPLTHEMRAAWIAIPRHGNLLDAVAHARDFDTIVRYAAINWRKRTLRLDEPDFHEVAASYGAQLETALGYRALGNLDRARDWFRCAIAYAQYRTLARKGLLDVEEPYEIEIDIPPIQLSQQAAPLPEPPPPPPTPARASYLEGRALLLQRKLHEAQVCFASAVLLDPMMLEAQLLRREVDRMLGRIRATTGMPTSMPIDVPASLREVREIVLGGRIRDAIAVLSTDTYANNVDAPLFRARLLALDGQYDRAASTFASITDGPHVDEARLGLARVTIDRGKPEAALALLDEILATRPRDLGALEARARCLDLLGRTEEASEAMKAFVAAVELASDVCLARAT
jgi:tetratricopeptide (TPR) repeat protein